ncbi:MAG: hypothetical protein R3C03_05830 [Pirellulaceae bacterium]
MSNRIQLGPLATITNRSEKQNVVRDATSTYALSRQHQILLPMHYERHYAYPLIVWFHSAGDDASQLNRIMPEISLRNYVAVAPLGTTGNLCNGFTWEHAPHDVDEAANVTIDAIDFALARTNIASNKIFFAGYAEGGTMALRLGLKMANRVAGVISINGGLPNGLNPLGNWKGCRQVPVLLSHCKKSTEFSEVDLCEQLKLLHVGGFNVTVRQYPFGDELPAIALTDVNRWIMESINSAIH